MFKKILAASLITTGLVITVGQASAYVAQANLEYTIETDQIRYGTLVAARFEACDEAVHQAYNNYFENCSARIDRDPSFKKLFVERCGHLTPETEAYGRAWDSLPGVSEYKDKIDLACKRWDNAYDACKRLGLNVYSMYSFRR